MRGTTPADRSPGYRSRFDTFYRTWQPYCLRLAVQSCDSEDEAADIVQEVFQRLYRRGDWVDLQRPRSYLARAVHWEAKRASRSRLPELELTAKLADRIPVTRPGPEELAIRAEGRRLLHSLLVALPEAERAATTLHLAGLTVREIADGRGVSPKTVEKQMASGRKRLQEMCGEVVRSPLQEGVHFRGHGGGGAFLVL